MRQRLAVCAITLALASCVTSSSPPTKVVTVGDAQDGQSVSAHVGDTVGVVLDSTAWTISGSSDPGILQPQGGQTVSPAPQGSCFPGMACGTTSAEFRALKRGSATVSATRVSCGEARVCVGHEGMYQVTVVVS
jgi:hypothetical protein